MIPDKEKLEEIIKELQKIMRIQDWDIGIEFISQYEMKHIFKADDLDTAMMCERYRLRKEARVYVNIDHTALPNMWYESVVHELYHIVTGEIGDIADDLMDELDSSETTRRQKKQATEVMAVHLSKIFTSLYPVTNFIKEGDSDAVKEG